MSKINRNYFSFLGGEVSRNLFNRIDMQQNAKWFETAKNIYFDNTGGLLNRRGFKRIGVSINGNEGGEIKLIPFVFNRNESYCIELGRSYFRIIKNGKFIKNGDGEIIKIYHDIPLNNIEDISYAQIADVLYIANGNNTKIKTISRYSETDWRFEDFDYAIPPMTSFNSDKKKTLSFSATENSNSGYSFRFEMPDNLILGYFKDVKIVLYLNGLSSGPTITENIFYNETTQFNSIQEFVSFFNSNQIGDHNLTMLQEGNTNFVSIFFPDTIDGKADASRYYKAQLQIKNGATSTLLEAKSIQSKLEENQYGHSFIVTANPEEAQYWAPNKFSFSYAQWSQSSGKWIKKTISYSLLNHSLEASLNFIFNTVYDADIYHKKYNSSKLPTFSEGNPTNFYINIIATYHEEIDGNFYGVSDLTMYYAKSNDGAFIRESNISQSYCEDGVNKNFFEVTSQYDKKVDHNNFSFFSDKKVGDVFCVKSVYSPSPQGVIGENKTYANNSMDGSIDNIVTPAFWSNGDWRIVTSGLLDGSIEMQYSYDGNIWYTHRTFTSSVRTQNDISYSTNYNEYGHIEVDDNVLLRLKFSGSAERLGVIFDTGSFENISYYKILELLDAEEIVGTADDDSEITETVYGCKALVECIKNPIGTPQVSYKWADASWSDTNGYPKIVFTYQNRLGFASTNTEPQTIWFSKTDDFKSFDVNVKVRDTDPITISTLKPKGISDIVNIQSSKKLFIFTSDYEFAIKDDGALTQKNKEIINYTSYGSSSAETQVVANRILFVERGGSSARELIYNIVEENYEAKDITVHFKHLFANNNTIKTTSYVAGEYKIYLMLTKDGTLICYKYIPEQDIMACSKFKHSAGKITNVICISGENSSQHVYIAVDIDGYKYIETLMTDEEGSYIDSIEDIILEEPSNTYKTNYLRGRELLLIIPTTFDENNEIVELGYITDVIVGDNGVISLPRAMDKFQIGFRIVAEATLIPPSIFRRDGSSLIYNKKNICKCHITFSDSYGFKIGIKGRNNFNTIYNISNNEIIDNEVTQTSGKKDVVISSSYSDENMLSFVQELPYKMEINNIELEVDYGGK